jgi:DHA2 family multidrug resistance protein-like MFS transporter
MFQDPRQRSVAVGFWIASFSVGEAIGPLLGGVLLEHFWWGSVFLLAIPVIAVLLIVSPRVLPEYRDPDAGHLDLVSAAMSVVAVLAVIFGLKEIAQDGLSVIAVVAIAAGLALAVGFVVRQRRLADPMIDVGLFRLRLFNAALAANFLAIFIAVGYFLFVAQYLQLVIGLSPLGAGLWSLPSAVAFIIGSQLVPRLLYGVRPAYVVAGGLALASIGLGLLTQVGVTSGLVPLIAGSVIISLGLAPVFGVTTELIVGAAPPEQAGAASGISETAAELGGALGIAILGSVGLAIYRSQLADRLPAAVPAEVVEAARDTLGSATAAAAQLPGDLGAAVLTAAREAFVVGIQLSSAIAAGIGLALAVLTLAVLHNQQPTALEKDAEVVSTTAAHDGPGDSPGC